MIDLIVAVSIIVVIKHFLFKGQSSKSFSQSELKELIESRQEYRARARKYL